MAIIYRTSPQLLNYVGVAGTRLWIKSPARLYKSLNNNTVIMRYSSDRFTIVQLQSFGSASKMKNSTSCSLSLILIATVISGE